MRGAQCTELVRAQTREAGTRHRATDLVGRERNDGGRRERGKGFGREQRNVGGRNGADTGGINGAHLRGLERTQLVGRKHPKLSRPQGSHLRGAKGSDLVDGNGRHQIRGQRFHILERLEADGCERVQAIGGDDAGLGTREGGDLVGLKRGSLAVTECGELQRSQRDHLGQLKGAQIVGGETHNVRTNPAQIVGFESSGLFRAERAHLGGRERRKLGRHQCLKLRGVEPAGIGVVVKAADLVGGQRADRVRCERLDD